MLNVLSLATGVLVVWGAVNTHIALRYEKNLDNQQRMGILGERSFDVSLRSRVGEREVPNELTLGSPLD